MVEGAAAETDCWRGVGDGSGTGTGESDADPAGELLDNEMEQEIGFFEEAFRLW